jgi:hypothetical protein
MAVNPEVPGMNPGHFFWFLQKTLKIDANSYQRKSNEENVGFVLNMNECLNNDEDDEEAHRWSSSCFFTTNCVSSADTQRQTILFHDVPLCNPLPSAGDRCPATFLCTREFRKHNGLITG